jgi:hypothetical protein
LSTPAEIWGGVTIGESSCVPFVFKKLQPSSDGDNSKLSEK